MRKKIVTLLTVALLMMLCAGVFSACKKESAVKELNIYNWTEYIDEEIIDEFETWYEEVTGEKIEVNYYGEFETNEQMVELFDSSEFAGDLVCISDYAIESLVNRNLVKVIDKTNAAVKPNYNYFNNIEKEIYAKGDDFKYNLSDYYLPYSYGTLGIMYDTEVITKKEAENAGYGLLWNSLNKTELNGGIYMKNSLRDSYAAAALYLREQGALPSKFSKYTIGELISSADDELIAFVEKALIDQKQFLSGNGTAGGCVYISDGLAEYIDYTELSMPVALMWSGEAISIIEEHPKYAYFVPKSGGNFFFDGFVIPKAAKNPEAAQFFLSFLCRPDIAVRNSVVVGYGSAVNKEILKGNSEACALLLEAGYDIDEFFADSIRYPSYAKLALMQDFTKNKEEILGMWEGILTS
ncbi:MAG: extracellular solute-binding protein [Christensenellaceae bacterium]|jgi:spermidine/putrescine transport system substrate-binding protein|nr:extracellular solute-binding protein [Christensenellaceae bacterium]